MSKLTKSMTLTGDRIHVINDTDVTFNQTSIALTGGTLILPSAIKKQALFSMSGTLSVAAIPTFVPNASGGTYTISKVYLIVRTAPTGQAIIVDIHKDGTTIFTDQGHRPQIAATATTGNTTTIDVPTWADGSYLEAIIDQVGSGTVGVDLTVVVVYG